MNLTSSPSRAWKSCQAWPELAGSRGSQSRCHVLVALVTSPDPGSDPTRAAAGAGPRGPSPGVDPRDRPRESRANSWKVMAPSRSASKPLEHGLGVGRPHAQLRAQRAELLTLRRPGGSRRRRRRRSVAGPAPQVPIRLHPAREGSGARGPPRLRRRWGVRGHLLPLGAEASWARSGRLGHWRGRRGGAKRLGGSVLCAPTKLRAQTCASSASPRAVRAHLWPPSAPSAAPAATRSLARPHALARRRPAPPSQGGGATGSGSHAFACRALELGFGASGVGGPGWNWGRQ